MVVYRIQVMWISGLCVGASWFSLLCFPLRQYKIFFNHISLNASWNDKCFRQSCRENQNTHLMLINST
jgi:hypothetical protein